MYINGSRYTKKLNYIIYINDNINTTNYNYLK